jgi:hypothetical protein
MDFRLDKFETISESVWTLVVVGLVRCPLDASTCDGAADLPAEKVRTAGRGKRLCDGCDHRAV